MGQSISWLLATALLFLCLWIVLPAPNLFCLRLAVGAPEISPLLGVIALLTLAFLWGGAPRQGSPLLMAIPSVMLLISLGLSILPLLALPGTLARTDATFNEVLGPPPKTIVSRGSARAAVRYRTGIPLASPHGSSLTLNLYQPSAPGHYPAVITLYGGGWQSGSPDESTAIGRFLAKRGYVVVALDYRHAPGHSFPAQIDDVRQGLAFVDDRTREFEIDRDRIALLGWSAGAHLALLAGFQPAASLPFRGIIDYYGPVDLAAGYAHPPTPDPLNIRQILAHFLGGTPTEKPTAYAQASPITYVRSAAPGSLPPTLLIYGERDHVVEARFGRALRDAIQASGNLALWLPIPWAEHAFDKIFYGLGNQVALRYIERFLAQI